MNTVKQKKKTQNGLNVKRITATVAFFILIITIAVIFFIFSDKIHDYFNDYEIIGAYERDLKVHFIDVGQGDAIIVELPDGSNVLIDSGSDDGDNDVEKDNALTRYIDSLKIDKFDFVIATHSDDDHIGMMETVFHNYEVDCVLRPKIPYVNEDNEYSFKSGFNAELLYGGYVCSSDAYFRFLRAVEKEGCEWSFFNYNSDLFYKIKDVSNEYVLTFDFLTPAENNKQVVYSSSNEYSPIIVLEYRGKRFMFTGDAEKSTIAELYENYEKSDCMVDVLKVPHHGSETSTTETFLNWINPEYAVISCGVNNEYGHPHQNVLDMLFSANVPVFRTDLQGSVTFEVARNGNIKYSVERDVSFEDLLLS